MTEQRSPKQRGLWTETQLREVMNAVRDGMSVKGASDRFSIPRRTLRNHLISGSMDKKMGRPTYLSQEQEEELGYRIRRLAEIGMPITTSIGQVIPPLVIFKGQRVKPDWLDNMPVGTQICMSPKGSMATAIFIRWLQHFSNYKTPGKTLLIFDGATSHLDANIVDAAEENNIVLYCLPSNTTHLQPMDKSVFRPFETFWDDEVLRFWETHPERKITRVVFGSILQKVWTRAVTAANVISGFRGTGIFPFDPSVIPPEAFAPSELTRSSPDNVSSAVQSRNEVISSGSSSDTLSSTSDEETIEEPQSKKSNTLNKISSTQTSPTISEILKTPNIKKPRNINRKKSFNYRGKKIARELFESRERKPTDANKPGPSGIQSTKESWYCFICRKNRVMDMVLCQQCLRYVHEVCVGVTKDDVLNYYLCPECQAGD